MPFHRCREYLLAKWRTPRAFTTILPIAPGQVEAVRRLLQDQRNIFLETLPAVPGLHTLRIVVVPGPQPVPGRARLLINSVHDAPPKKHLKELLENCEPLIEAIRTAGSCAASEELPAYLTKHRVYEQTLHLGAIRKTVAEILAEDRLRHVVQNWLNDNCQGSHGDSLQVELLRRRLRDHVRRISSDGSLPRDLSARLSLSRGLFKAIDLCVTFMLPTIGVLRNDIEAAIRRMEGALRRRATWCLYGVWWIYAAIPVFVALKLLAALEAKEADESALKPDPATVERIETAEDLLLKNEVSLWFSVKGSWVRRWLLRLILWGSERGCRHFWTDGRLADIETIHYARIMQVDRGRIMLFMSDYDGSLNRYLDDFVGVGSRAVVPISSNVHGCPPTRKLFHPADPGSFDQRWRSMIRGYQLETAIWFTAYPKLTVRDIQNNACIRNGLFAETLSEAEAREWASKL